MGGVETGTATAGAPGAAGAPGVSFQVFASIVATFGGLVVGYSLGYTSPANPDLHSYIIHTSRAQESLIGSMAPLGALFGSLVAGYVMETLGRRSAMVIFTVPALVGWMFITYASRFGTIIVGRLISGFSAGCSSVVAPTYVAEVTAPNIRGAMGAAFQLQIAMGILLSNVIGKFLRWDYLAMTIQFFPVVWLVLLCFVCESPLWLIDKGREQQATDSLLWLRGSGADVKGELAQMRAQIEEIRSKQASFRDLRRPENLKPFIMSLVIMLCQQLCGINAVVFYTKNIFIDAGSTIDSSVSSIIVSSVQVSSTFAAMILVDRLGRKVLLIVSGSIMSLCLAVLGVYFYLSNTSYDVLNIGWLPLLCLMLYMFAFSVGFGPIAWLMLGELFAPEVKGLASSAAAAFNWFLGFVVAVSFDPMIEGLTEAGTLWVFSIICAAAAVYVFFFVYETRGKSLKDIQEHFKYPT